MRFIIWERSVQKKTDFWIVLCCILKEPKINMLEFSCWCKKNSQSIHEELHSIPLIFLNKKSEIWNDFTIFEKWKVKNFLPSLFSRSESENQMTQNRDREVKVKIKWLKIEIEKWIFKKNLENSRESRLSLVTVMVMRMTTTSSLWFSMKILDPPNAAGRGFVEADWNRDWGNTQLPGVPTDHKNNTSDKTNHSQAA